MSASRQNISVLTSHLQWQKKAHTLRHLHARFPPKLVLCKGNNEEDSTLHDLNHVPCQCLDETSASSRLTCNDNRKLKPYATCRPAFHQKSSWATGTVKKIAHITSTHLKISHLASSCRPDIRNRTSRVSTSSP